MTEPFKKGANGKPCMSLMSVVDMYPVGEVLDFGRFKHKATASNAHTPRLLSQADTMAMLSAALRHIGAYQAGFQWNTEEWTDAETQEHRKILVPHLASAIADLHIIMISDRLHGAYKAHGAPPREEP